MTFEDRGELAGELSRGELVPAVAPASMREWAERLVARAREDGIALTGEGGLLTDLMRYVLQTGLEVEMADHLGYERGEAPPGGAGNARNGAYDKTVTTEIGEVELRIPRDRQGTFEPVTVPKYQRRDARVMHSHRCRCLQRQRVLAKRCLQCPLGSAPPLHAPEPSFGHRKRDSAELRSGHTATRPPSTGITAPLR